MLFLLLPFLKIHRINIVLIEQSHIHTCILRLSQQGYQRNIGKTIENTGGINIVTTYKGIRLLPHNLDLVTLL